MTEIKKCPHCGGKAEIKNIYTQTGSHLGVIITCVECENRTAYKDTEPEAIAAWNKRAKDENSLTLDEIRAVVEYCLNLDCDTLNYLMQEFEKACKASNLVDYINKEGKE